MPTTSPDTLSILYTTLPDRETARSIGRTLVLERLVGCANVIDGMTSIYVWEGELQEGHEAILLLKTPSSGIEVASQRVRELHPYDCPAIISWQLNTVNADYLRWMTEQVASPA